MRKRLLWLAFSAVMVLAIVTPAFAADTGLVKVDSNILVKSKMIPATDFYGEIGYAKMEFVFASSGAIQVTYADACYQFKSPFGDQGNALVETYQSRDGSQVLRTYRVNRHTATYVFDFNKYKDRVGLDFRGNVGLDSLDIGIMPIDGEFKVRGRTAWVGKFDPVTDECISGVGFDWNDATQVAAFDDRGSLDKRIRFSVPQGKDFVVDPSVVGTSTSSAAFSFPRKTFYANGRHWVFYNDGTNMVWRTSTDGTSWSAATTAVAGSWYFFQVHYDGTYLHYARGDGGSHIYYRRGTPEAAGTITWSAVEQTAVTAGSGAPYVYGIYPHSVTVDSTGHPYIGYMEKIYSYISGWMDENYYAKVTKSSTTDGTWATAGGFPSELHSVNYFHFGYYFSYGGQRVSVLNLGAGHIYGAFTIPVDTLNGREWDGGAWGGSETITSGAYGSTGSLAVTGGKVGVAYLKTSSYDVAFKERSAIGVWGSEETVQASTTSSSYPVLSTSNASGDLVCFWAGSPSANHIYYKERISGSWDGSPTDWYNETDTLTSNGLLSSFLQYGGGYVGLMYMAKAAPPYDVKYGFLSLVTTPSIISDNASAIATTSARLNSTVDADGGDLCQVRWGYGLVSKTAVQFDTYGTVTAWTGVTYSTGDHPYYDAGSLSANTTYYYRVQIQNSSDNMVCAIEQTFATEAALNPPTNFKGIPSADVANLSWTVGVGATQTQIVSNPSHYASDNTDGTIIFFGTGNSFEYDGLTAGTTYYLSAWGESGGAYSTAKVTLMLTTSGAGGGGGTLEAPLAPYRWLSAPDYSGLSGLPFGVYDAVNDAADANSIPKGSAWLILAVAIAGGLALVIYLLSKSAIASLLTLLGGLGFGTLIQLVPMWIPVFALIGVIAMIIASRREVPQP